MTSDFMTSATQRFASDEFISLDESSDRPWGFKQVGAPIGVWQINTEAGRMR